MSQLEEILACILKMGDSSDGIFGNKRYEELGVIDIGDGLMTMKNDRAKKDCVHIENYRRQR